MRCRTCMWVITIYATPTKINARIFLRCFALCLSQLLEHNGPSLLFTYLPLFSFFFQIIDLSSNSFRSPCFCYKKYIQRYIIYTSGIKSSYLCVYLISSLNSQAYIHSDYSIWKREWNVYYYVLRAATSIILLKV